ncbi:MAG: FHA domain-containing protein [Polyangiaceae bacterium]
MFAVIISEKGGAERRETFDKPELKVGRVQGNDLVLPKGNVSKHHAKLLFKDGRFIVSDLNSTNGTYVNGRKIAQATIVREGDKVYVGDFVIRLELPQSVGGNLSAPPLEGADQEVPTMARENPLRNMPPLVGPSGPPQPVQQRPSAPPAPAAPPARADARPQMGTALGIGSPVQGPPQAPLGPPPLSDYGGPSPSPWDRVSEPPPPPEPPPPAPQFQPPAQPPAMPASPQVAGTPMGAPVGAGPKARVGGPRPGTIPLESRRPSVAPPPVAPPQAAPAAPSMPAQGPTPPPLNVMTAPPDAGPMTPAAKAPAPLPVETRENSAQLAGRTLALLSLMKKIASAIDLGALPLSPDAATVAQLERVVRDQAAQLRASGGMLEGIDLELVTADALSELTGLGPLEALLEDDVVTEIQALRPDQILVRKGERIEQAETGFTGELAQRRIVTRLLAQAGTTLPENGVAECRLPRGAHLVALLPPASRPGAFLIRKRRHLENTLEDLLRANSLSRPMASFLEACTLGRTNLLVAASSGTAGDQLIAALASLVGSGERVVVVQNADAIHPHQAHVVSVSASAEAIRAACLMGADRLLMSSTASNVAGLSFEAIAGGVHGVVVVVVANSLKQAFARLSSQITLGRPGVSAEAARECIGESFDLAVEVGSSQGRLRVSRIAEMAGSDAKGIVSRDIFSVFGGGPEGGEGTFAATGVVPRVLSELQARGVRVDASIFKKK